MNSREAKEILQVYRPGGADEGDPQFAEALEQVKRDPELSRWFERHCALYTSIQAKFKQIPVPTDLKERILVGRADRKVVSLWSRPAFLTAAAIIVALAGLAAFWFSPGEDNSFSAFRNRMVRAALRDYQMNMVTNDLKQIREFLAKNQGHADFALTKPMEKLPGEGCGVLSWHGKRVSVVCFDLGQAPRQRNDLFLFVIHRSALPDAPPTAAPEVVQVKKLVTASWSTGDKIYILAGRGDQEFIRKFF